jgi:hypothetical protein
MRTTLRAACQTSRSLRLHSCVDFSIAARSASHAKSTGRADDAVAVHLVDAVFEHCGALLDDERGKCLELSLSHRHRGGTQPILRSARPELREQNESSGHDPPKRCKSDTTSSPCKRTGRRQLAPWQSCSRSARAHFALVLDQSRPLLIVRDSNVLWYTPQVQVMRGVVLTREAVPSSSARFLGGVRLCVLTGRIRFNRTKADNVHPAVDACHES